MVSKVEKRAGSSSPTATLRAFSCSDSPWLLFLTIYPFQTFKCSGEEDVGDLASLKELELGSKGTVSLNSMNGFEERAIENRDDGSCVMSEGTEAFQSNQTTS